MKRTRLPSPRTIRPWEDSYGPNCGSYVQHLCRLLAAKNYKRADAVELIREYGKAEFVADVKPENYPALIAACREKLGLV